MRLYWNLIVICYLKHIDELVYGYLDSFFIGVNFADASVSMANPGVVLMGLQDAGSLIL